MPPSPEKKLIIKESIRRLLELGISGKEIIDNLKSVGIDEQVARDILSETKGEMNAALRPFPAQAPQEPAKGRQGAKPQPAPKAAADDDEEMTDDLYGSVYEEIQEEKLRTPVIRKPINNPQYEPASQGQKGNNAQAPQAAEPPQPQGSEDLAELWEKGILSTVNARLAEIKQIKDDLDSVLDQKISERLKIESKKIEVVLDSQRTLFYSRIDAHLESKADELRRVLESRAKQLEDVNAKAQQQLAQVQAEKKFNAEFLGSITQKMVLLDSTRSQVLSETNSSLISMETKFREFMSESSRKRDELEQRIKGALQLETSVTDGMVESARQKIDALRLAKEKELTDEVAARLAEFDEMARKVDPKGITQKLAELNAANEKLEKKEKELDSKFERKAIELEKIESQRFEDFKKEFTSFKREVAKIEEGNLAQLKKEYAENVDELFSVHLEAWNKAIAGKKKEIDELKGEVDIEKYNATLDALGEFKEQFLATVKKSIQDYNKSKKELAESIIERDKAINEYLKKIDAKMQELSDFQKSFSKDVADLLGKIPDEGEKGKGRK